MIHYGMIHCHSEFSAMDSPQSIKTLVTTAKEMGCPAIALTDHGNMLGIPSFFKECESQGIKPIAGVEAYVEENKEGRKHLIILAKDKIGYRAISHAVTLSNERIYSTHYGNYPRMNKEILLKCFGPGTEGYRHVIFTSACISGPVAMDLLYNIRLRKMIDKLSKAQERFISPKDEYYRSLTKQYFNLIAEIKDLKETQQEFRKLGKQAKKEVACYTTKIKATTEIKNKIKKDLEKMQKKVLRYNECEEKKNNIRCQYRNDLYQTAVETAKFYQSLGEFYIELQYHGIQEELICMPQLLKIATELSIPTIVSNDVHFAKKEDCEVRNYLQALRLERWGEIREEDKELYIKGDDELTSYLTRIFPQEAVETSFQNIGKVVQECNFKYEKEDHYPVYIGEENFKDLIQKGIQKRCEENNMIWDDNHKQRLSYEMNVIVDMGFCDYFMIIAEIINYSKAIGNVPTHLISRIPENTEEAIAFGKKFPIGVGVGPGRGSAVGSLVAYLMGITEVDPLKYDLYFERFLNKDRVTMPDIDTDFRPELIPSVIKFLKNIYGQKAVSSISTNIRYGGKQALLAAGRILKYKTGDNAYHEFAVKLSAQYGPDFASYNSGKMGEITQIAKKLRGILATNSTHAAGVIISDSDNVSDYVPMLYNQDSACWAVQCDMIEAEEHGLLKMDLLKLICLTICNECFSFIQYNGRWETIPFEREVFENIYCTGDLNGVFQCENHGMQQVIKEFGPTCIEDLVLLVAAYRPGPMDSIPDMIAVKKGEKKPSYIVPALEEILSYTYGKIIYQEQVMRIFQNLAGYSLADADLVRRAMSKKNTEKLLIEKEAFIYGNADRNILGCVNNGISEKKAALLFESMIDFARYAFNKSHAVAYAIVSYRTAYLKYHYPLAYLTSYLNYKPGEIGKVMEDCRKYGIEVLKPEINLSKEKCIIFDGKILLGLSHIALVANFASEIVKNRNEKGKFVSREDFLERLPAKKNVLENLDKSGVFRNLPDDPKQTENLLLVEKKLFGSFLSREVADALLHSLPDTDLSVPQKYAKIGGLILEITERRTKRNDNMAIVHLATKQRDISICIFPELYRMQKHLLREGNCILVAGEYKQDDFGFSFMAKEIQSSEQKRYYIRKSNFEEDKLASFLTDFGGRLYLLMDDGTFSLLPGEYSYEIASVPEVKTIPQI